MSLLSWEEYDKQFHLSEVLTHAARACVSSHTLLPETFLASYFTERVNKDAIEWIRCATTFTSHGICLQFTIHLYVNVEIVATTLPIHFTEEEILSYAAYINERNNKLLLFQERQGDNTDKEQNLEEEQQQQQQQQKLQKNQSSRKNVKKDGNRDNTSKSRNGLHSADQEQEMKEEINKVHNYEKLCSELKTLIEQNSLCELQTVQVSDQAKWDNCLQRKTFTLERDNEEFVNNSNDVDQGKKSKIDCEEGEKTRVQITLPVEVQKVLSLMALQSAAQSRSMELYYYIYSSPMLKQIGVRQSNRDNSKDVNINDENDADNKENLKTLQLPYLLIPFFGRFVEQDTNINTNCVNGENKNTNISNNNTNNNNNNVPNYANSQHTTKGIVSFETLYIVIAPYKQQERHYQIKEKTSQTNNMLVNNMQETYEPVVNYEFLIKLQRAVELFKTRFGEVQTRADGALLYDNFENITDAVNVAVELLEASGIEMGREVTLGICVNCALSTIEHVNVNIKARTKGAKSMTDDKKKGKAAYNTNKEKKNDRSTPEVKKTILEQLSTTAEEEVDNINNNSNNNNNKDAESKQEEFYYNLFPNDVEISGLQLTEYLTEQVEESKGLLTVIINSHNLNDNRGMCRLMRKVGSKVRLVCNLPEMELDDITHSSTQDNAYKDKEITSNNHHTYTSLFVHDYIARFDSMPLVTQIIKQITKIMEHEYSITSDISRVEHNVNALTNVAIGLQSTLLMIGGICSNTLQDICTTYHAIASIELKKSKCTRRLEMSKTLVNSEKYALSLKTDNSENDIIPEIKRKNEKKQKKTAREKQK